MPSPPFRFWLGRNPGAFVRVRLEVAVRLPPTTTGADRRPAPGAPPEHDERRGEAERLELAIGAVAAAAPPRVK